MGAAKVAREAVQMASEKWYEMINALAVVNGPVAYKHIIDHINQPVSESYNVAAVVVPVRLPTRTPPRFSCRPRTLWSRRPWKNSLIKTGSGLLPVGRENFMCMLINELVDYARQQVIR